MRDEVLSSVGAQDLDTSSYQVSDLEDIEFKCENSQLDLDVAASFCIYQAHTENKVGQHREIKSESPCDKEYKKYCMNGGERYYLVDENIVACNCTWLYGEKRC